MFLGVYPRPYTIQSERNGDDINFLSKHTPGLPHVGQPPDLAGQAPQNAAVESKERIVYRNNIAK